MNENKVTPEMMQAIEITENNENHEACTKCNGVCCQQMGCEIFPQDVKRWFHADFITKEMIQKLLDSGYVMLDWWEGDVRFDEFDYEDDGSLYEQQTFYLHMRDNQSAAIHGSWGGTCKAFESGKGCKLTWEQRPTGGRALLPDPNGDHNNCDSKVSNASKAGCCLAWYPYQDLLMWFYENYKS